MRDHQNKRTSMNRPTVINILLRIESTAKKYNEIEKTKFCICMGGVPTQKKMSNLPILYIYYIMIL